MSQQTHRLPTGYCSQLVLVKARIGKSLGDTKQKGDKQSNQDDSGGIIASQRVEKG